MLKGCQNICRHFRQIAEIFLEHFWKYQSWQDENTCTRIWLRKTWQVYNSYKDRSFSSFRVLATDKQTIYFPLWIEVTKTPFTRAKKIGTACQIFGTVLTILRHGTPNFRCVNVSVPHVMWHQCRDYLPEVVSARVNEARCQKFGVPCRFV